MVGSFIYLIFVLNKQSQLRKTKQIYIIMIVTSAKQGDVFVALENGEEWRPYPKLSVNVKDRPFKDLNGDVLTFDSMQRCVEWCEVRNNLMNINHF